MAKDVQARALVMVALILLLDLTSGIVGGSHTPAGIGTGDPPSTPSTQRPTIDDALADLAALAARHQETIDELLAESRTDPRSIAPIAASRVIEDSFEPEARIGGIGAWNVTRGHWRLDNAEGRSAWLTTDPLTGTYGGMETLLVSPGLDLSAYAVNVCDHPYACGTLPATLVQSGCSAVATVGGLTPGPIVPAQPIQGVVVPVCVTIADRTAIQPMRNLVNLVVEHRYNFAPGADGGQVLVFPDVPPGIAGARGTVLTPLEGHGSYAASVKALDGQPGYTGAAGPEAAVFDLTPWAGRVIWIGFKAAAIDSASNDPEYFDPANFERAAPFGWEIDAVSVQAVAYGRNLKVYGFEGPRYRTHAKDPFDRTPLGENVTLGAIVLNAGGAARNVSVKLVVRGLGADIEAWHAKDLAAGEVWVPRITVRAPTTEGETFTLEATAQMNGTAGDATLDATPSDNSKSRTYRASNTLRAELGLAVGTGMLDYDVPQTAQVTVTNTGNRRLLGSLALTETHEVHDETGPSPRSILHGVEPIDLAPGASTERAWPVTTAHRGTHELVARITTVDGYEREARLEYYVHASPPPILYENRSAATPGWSVARADYPIPDEDGMWVARASSASGSFAALRAFPTVEAVALGPEARFRDLEFSARYMAVNQKLPARVDLVYRRAAPHDLGVAQEPNVVVWSTLLDSATTDTEEHNILREEDLSWREKRLSLVLDPAKGYADLWTVQGLEVNVVTKAYYASATEYERSSFFLDDLRITGIPVGGEAADRFDIVRISGNEPFVDGGNVSPQGAEPSVRPSLPSSCPWERPLGTLYSFNCWRPVTRDAALLVARHSNWTLGRAEDHHILGDSRSLFEYRVDGLGSDYPDRLVSPPLFLKEALDPMLTFDHAYMLKVVPLDAGATSIGYRIKQVGYVEIQFLQDDGNWSRFFRLEPEQGYPDPLGMTPIGPRRAVPKSFDGGVAYYHPPPCTVHESNFYCDQGGYFRMVGDYPAYGALTWNQIPSPAVGMGETFRLFQRDDYGTNMSNRWIRVAFHVSGPSEAPEDAGQVKTLWSLDNIRLTPTSVFGVDAAVKNISIDVSYDWRRLGVGPGTRIPINVTVSNVGKFSERFAVAISISPIGGERLAREKFDLGLMGPGTNLTTILEFEIPDLAGERRYVIEARVVPEDATMSDDNPVNDVATLGSDGSFVARRREDASVVGEVFPEVGRPDLTRYLPTKVYNLGNVPLAGLVVTRTIERLEPGPRTTIEERQWRIANSIEPDPNGVAFDTLTMSPASDPDAQYFAVESAGAYLVTFEIGRAQPDDDPSNDLSLRWLMAREAVLSEDFESPDGWAFDQGGIWGAADGFRSLRAAGISGNPDGAIEPGTDASITSPWIPLAATKAATLNFFSRYDLESRYDGGRVEVSRDNETWIPLHPVDVRGRPTDYPLDLVGSNPLSEDENPAQLARGFSGDSRRDPNNLDGWVPVSMNLNLAPELSEDVEFLGLPLPRSDGAGYSRVANGTYAAPWMTVDDAPPGTANRWEIENLTEPLPAVGGLAWWTGAFTTQDAPVSHKLERTFALEGLNASDVLEITWWDHRAGTTGSDWRGIGVDHRFSVTQNDAQEVPRVLFTEKDLVLRESAGAWNLVSLQIAASRLNLTRPVTVAFSVEAKSVTVANTGWALDEIRFRAVAIENGSKVEKKALIEDVEDHTNWEPTRWSLVDALPGRPAPWRAVVAVGAEGLTVPMWNLTMQSNLDTRLVSPEINLAELGGIAPALVVNHRYEFTFQETGKLNAGDPLSRGKRYSGGVVEVSKYNRTASRWDPWEQAFATREGPAEAIERREATGAADARGAPYSHVIVESGDTFERFERSVAQNYYRQTVSYWRVLDQNSSYAFSGSSGGFVSSRFDLSAYAGDRIRLAFHAFSNPTTTGGPDPARYWLLSSAQINGRVLVTDDLRARFRLGTDASGLSGTWAIDQFEVIGIPYEKSVGIELSRAPSRVASIETAEVAGILRNHGSQPRTVFVGIRELAAEPRIGAVVSVGGTRPTKAPWSAVSGPFELAPAGSEGARAPFGFFVTGTAQKVHRLYVEVLEGTFDALGESYAISPEEVPGRARRSFDLAVQDVRSGALVAPQLDPPHLDAPGNVTVGVTLANTGTLRLDPVASLTVRDASGNEVPSAAVEWRPGELMPGTSRPVTASIRLPAEGNYEITLTLKHAHALLATHAWITRVARHDVFHSVTFDADLEGWMAEGFQWTEDDARYGPGSVLMGVNNSAYSLGARAEALPARTGRLTSPVLDARLGGSAPALVFWHKPRFGSMGAVAFEVAPGVLGESTSCKSWSKVPLPAQTATTGSLTGWTKVVVPIAGTPLANQVGCIRFTVTNADGQGWRLDEVALRGGSLEFAPAELAYPVTDSSVKEYPLAVTNTGAAFKRIVFGIEASTSRSTAEDHKWIRFDPPFLDLEPGTTATVVARLSTPTSRHAFARSVHWTLAAWDLLARGDAATTSLLVDFVPHPRADLNLALSIDNQPLNATRSVFEEAVPHEVSLVVTNVGFETSAPTHVIVTLVDDETGSEIWNHRENVPALRPFGASSDSYVVSGTWIPEFGARGNHTLRAVSDPDRRNPDFDHTNDDLALPLAVGPLLRPDLVVRARDVSFASPSGDPLYEAVPGEVVTIHALVRNEGQVPARSVTLRLVAGTTVLKEEFVPHLGPGESRLVRTNQLAPATSTVYRILAATPDVEIFSDNNERSLELPVYPAELGISVEATSIDLEPGKRRTIEVTIENRGPFPMSLRTSVVGVPFAALAPADLALGPGESRRAALTLDPPAEARPGSHPLTLRVEDGEGRQSRRTLVAEIEPASRAAIRAWSARGPPGHVRYDLEYVNAGNVPLAPAFRLLAENRTEIARVTLPAAAPGASVYASGTFAMDPYEPVGRRDLRLALEHAGTSIAERNVAITVLPWGRSEVTVRGEERTDVGITLQLKVAFDGNEAARRVPIVHGAPAGSEIRFDRPILHLAPGDVRDLDLDLRFPARSPPGEYQISVDLLDPDATPLREPPKAVRLPLDLRRPTLEIVDLADRAPGIRAGDTTEWTVVLRNAGPVAGRSIPVELYVDGVLSDRRVVDEVAPSRSRDVTLAWKATEGTHALVVTLAGDAGAPTERRAIASAIEVEPHFGEVPLKLVGIPDSGALLAAAAALLVGLGRRRRH